jgi:RNA polymerase sigma-70 factor (ECF subfamily)
MRVPEPNSDERGRVLYADLLALSDESVVRELQAGNTDAFAVIFKRFHRLVHVTALRIVKDAPEAEDVTQSVFLEIYRKVGQFDPARGKLKVWLLQYAYSRSIDQRNYVLGRQAEGHRDVEQVQGNASLFSATRLPSQESARLMREVLGILPEAQRETIEMFFFEGLTLKEIAQRRKETFSNVRHHYYRGLERLRTHLEEGPKRGEGQSDERNSVVRFGEVRRAET